MDKWMAFVDGENLTLRAQDLAGKNELKLIEGKYYERDRFVWPPNHHARKVMVPPIFTRNIQLQSIRSFYYTSVTGDTDALHSVREKLWSLGFDANVFKKPKKQEKAKGVDIALTKDMLSHAFLDNYDAAVLVAGDGDYVPLVEEVKRRGKIVQVVFFAEHGTSQELRLASDGFEDLTKNFLALWGQWIAAQGSKG
jgi:uncharacterized LabA/DUF88 family protein